MRKKLPIIPGKWYKGKTGKPRYVVHFIPHNVSWVHVLGGNPRRAWIPTWQGWAKAGPFDTREEAEKA